MNSRGPARKAFAIAGLGIVAALFPMSGTASACDPNKPPFCQTPCTLVRDAYRAAFYASGGYNGPLPSWYELDLMDCG